MENVPILWRDHSPSARSLSGGEMFVGRSALLALVEQCVQVSGGSQVGEGLERPVLLVAGGGGSGRSELLRTLWSEWKQETP